MLFEYLTIRVGASVLDISVSILLMHDLARPASLRGPRFLNQFSPRIFLLDAHPPCLRPSSKTTDNRNSTSKFDQLDHESVGRKCKATSGFIKSRNLNYLFDFYLRMDSCPKFRSDWKSQLLTRNGQAAKQQPLTVLIAVIELTDTSPCNNVVPTVGRFVADSSGHAVFLHRPLFPSFPFLPVNCGIPTNDNQLQSLVEISFIHIDKCVPEFNLLSEPFAIFGKV